MELWKRGEFCKKIFIMNFGVRVMKNLRKSNACMELKIHITPKLNGGHSSFFFQETSSRVKVTIFDRQYLENPEINLSGNVQ